jgi:hypothetical protein
MSIRMKDLTKSETPAAADDKLQELTKSEMASLAGGAGGFMRGDVVGSTTAASDLSAASGGGKEASFPTHISNARFTQSATTLCNWSGCTYYNSGC